MENVSHTASLDFSAADEAVENSAAGSVRAREFGKFLGAQCGPAGVAYRVWAPAHETLAVVIEEPAGRRRVRLTREAEGYFCGCDPTGRPGDLYWYEMAGDLVPDPASRFQPRGIDGPSEVIDARSYQWVNDSWRRPPLAGRVIYELHVGAFTREGTFRAAQARLDDLAALGVNAIEVMPLGDFSGRWNWGYDGVRLFAPAHAYGSPDELRALVDAAHARGLAVIVDVVYNHLGPCGNVLPRFSDAYFHPTRSSGWGQSLNFDGPGSGPVREFFRLNAAMWLDEYRTDGLRLDAVHAIEDESSRHIVAELAALAHARGAFTIAEDERNDARIITPEADGGWGVDAMWSDDFHHTMRVALTGQREAHFGSYAGTIDEWADTLGHGWLFRGQRFALWDRARGTPASHLPAERFVLCISNHDQVGNRPLGDRLHAVVSPEVYRAVSVLLCLAPGTPLLFMGQEWGASSPFPFFTDHPGEIGAMMATYRRDEFRQRQADYPEDLLARMPDPQDEKTFSAAKLDWSERQRPEHARLLRLYRRCLHLRAAESVLHLAPRKRWQVGKATEAVLALRWSAEGGDWLLLVTLAPAAQAIGEAPLVRAGDGRHWKIAIDSNAPGSAAGSDSEANGADANGTGTAAAPKLTEIVGPCALLLRETRVAER